MARALTTSLRLGVIALLLFGSACRSTQTRNPTAERELKYGARMGRLGYWQEARFRFAAVVARDPNNARAHNNLAVAMEAGGEFAGAFEEYKKAISLASADRSIRQNYTRFAEFYTAYTKKVGKVSPAP